MPEFARRNTITAACELATGAGKSCQLSGLSEAPHATSQMTAVWSNSRNHMIEMNMDHGDEVFTSAEQDNLFEDALESLLNESR